MLFSLPWLSFLSIAVSPSDPVALIVDLLENIVYQSGQLVFKNHNQTDQYHHKISPLSDTLLNTLLLPHTHFVKYVIFAYLSVKILINSIITKQRT